MSAQSAGVVGVGNTWANTLHRLLARDGIGVRSVDIVRCSRWLTMVVDLVDPADLAKVARMDGAIELALSRYTPTTPVVGVRVQAAGGFVAVELGLPQSMHRDITAADVRACARASGAPIPHGLRVHLGLDALCAPCTLDLGADGTPHLLVVGATRRAGKTNAVQCIVGALLAQCTPEALGCILIDDKVAGLLPFARAAHAVHPLITDAREAIAALRWCTAELGRRKGALLRGETVHRRLLIVIDELAGVIQATGGKDGEAAQMLALLLSQGAGLGMHCLLATQHATGEYLGGALARANLPARLVGRVADVASSTAACGRGGCDAHTLLGRGDMLLITDGVRRIQVVAWDAAVLERIQQGDEEAPAVGPRLELVAEEGKGRAGAGGPRRGRPQDELTDEHLAYAIAHDCGPGEYAAALRIGTGKALRLQERARGLRAKIDAYRNTEMSEWATGPQIEPLAGSPRVSVLR